ncbi:hypothetical protein C8J56DRAFT_883639 [Mycena floridula]|nr:hypothetical protein C8J56DRAFT_883639 [Mycena floridula]
MYNTGHFLFGNPADKWAGLKLYFIHHLTSGGMKNTKQSNIYLIAGGAFAPQLPQCQIPFWPVEVELPSLRSKRDWAKMGFDTAAIVVQLTMPDVHAPPAIK